MGIILYYYQGEEVRLRFQNAITISYKEKLDEELFWIVRFKSKIARIVVWIIKCANNFSFSNKRKRVEIMTFLFFYASRFCFHLLSEEERRRVVNLFYDRITVIINGYPSSPSNSINVPSYLNLRFNSYINIFEKVPPKEYLKVLIDFQISLFNNIDNKNFSTQIFQDYIPSRTDYRVSTEIAEYYKEVMPIFMNELKNLICGVGYTNRWDDDNFDIHNPPIADEGEEDEGDEWEKVNVDNYKVVNIMPVYKKENIYGNFYDNSNIDSYDTTSEFSFHDKLDNCINPLDKIEKKSILEGKIFILLGIILIGVIIFLFNL
ncbi:MAG: hypothetical protein IKZ57_08040 [Spirochaetia bacterium]|nr:hypothetical protein [Spirochaetia bacterium]